MTTHPTRDFLPATTVLPFVLLFCALLGAAAPVSAEARPNYSIQAIRYGTIQGFPVSAFVMGAPKDE